MATRLAGRAETGSPTLPVWRIDPHIGRPWPRGVVEVLRPSFLSYETLGPGPPPCTQRTWGPGAEADVSMDPEEPAFSAANSVRDFSRQKTWPEMLVVKILHSTAPLVGSGFSGSVRKLLRTKHATT
jgi:hypothetical protein